MGHHFPTLAELDAARQAFRSNEPRDLFYRAATELTELARQKATSLTLAEALAVLLQTWNKPFYQYRKFDAQHFLDLEELMSNNKDRLEELRNRSIETLCDADQAIIEEIFEHFERVLGPVGAAKTLHILAPRYFPLWDRAIAEAYELRLGGAGTNGKRYYCFMKVSKEQIEHMGGMDAVGDNPLKAIDEYNYCRYTKHWIE